MKTYTDFVNESWFSSLGNLIKRLFKGDSSGIKAKVEPKSEIDEEGIERKEHELRMETDRAIFNTITTGIKTQQDISRKIHELVALILADFVKSTRNPFKFKQTGTGIMNQVNQLWYKFSSGEIAYFEFVEGGNSSILVHTKGAYVTTYQLNDNFTRDFITLFTELAKKGKK